MRKEKTIKGEYYRLSNCGNVSLPIFRDEEDYTRFLFLIVHLQSPIIFNHLSRPLPYFKKHGVFKTSEYTAKAIAKSRYVELVCFAVTSSRFDMVVRETRDDGIPYFMHRIQNAYSKFFNAKYKRRGHVFRGPYECKLVADKNQLAHVSAFLHTRPASLPEWKGREAEYPWSSYQDFDKNRWGFLLVHEAVTDRFNNERDYKRFTEHPSLKERKRILGTDHLIGAL